MKKLYIFSLLLFVVLVGTSYAEMGNPYSEYGISSSGSSGATVPSGTEGQMLYNNAGTWTAFSDVFWDDVNSRLGIGTASPTARTDIKASTADGSTDALILHDSGGNEILKVDSNGTIIISGGILKHRTSTATDYNPSALTTDYIIAVTDTTATRSVIISTEDVQSGTTAKPRIFIVKDESLAAGTNSITITLESGGTIEGNSDKVISVDGGSYSLYIDGTNAWLF